MADIAKLLFYFLAYVIFLALGLYSAAALIGIALGTISAFMDSRKKRRK